MQPLLCLNMQMIIICNPAPAKANQNDVYIFLQTLLVIKTDTCSYFYFLSNEGYYKKTIKIYVYYDRVLKNICTVKL